MAGFAIDVLNEAASREHIAVAWVSTTSSDDANDALASGRIDLMPAGMVTPERERRFYVAEPWWSTEVALVTRSDRPTVRRLAFTSIFQNLARSKFDNSVLLLPFPWSDHAVKAMCKGDADGVLLTHGEVHDIFLNRPDECLGVRLSSGDTDVAEQLSIISRKEQRDIAKRLRGRIDEMATDGTLMRLAAKNPPIPTSSAVQLESRVRQRFRLRLVLLGSIVVLVFGTWIVYQARRNALRDKRYKRQLEADKVELQRANVLLETSNAQLEAVLDSIPEPIMVTNAAGKLVRTNAAFKKDILHRATVDGYIGTTEAYTDDGRLIDPEQWPINRVRRGEQISGMDVILHVDGVRSDRRFSGSPVFDKDHNVTHAVVAFFDISDQKRIARDLSKANQEIQKAYDRISLANEAARIGTYEWFVDDNRVVWSPEMEKLYGIGSATHEHTFDEWRALVHPDDLAPTLTAMETAIAERQATLDTTYRIVREHGEIRWIHSRGKYEYDANGQPVHMLGMNIDITEQKRIEEELKEADEELRRSNEDLQAFAYTVSHDLREPIRQMTLFSDLLVRHISAGTGESDRPVIVQYIREGAQRMSAMMDGLLMYSRLGSAQTPKERVDCNAVVRDVVRDLGLQIAETGARIHAGELPTVEAWPGRLNHVFQNLIQNAIKYRKPDVAPEIHLCVEQRARDWLFSVRDNGIGFDQRYAEKIFTLFKQLHVRGHYDGMGMGLAIVKRIVERHGGEVCAEGAPGAGAKFYFTLPKPDGSDCSPFDNDNMATVAA